eukprot:g3785.t1
MSCRLSADNVSRIYFQSSRQWLVTDEVLDTVDNDVQLIIECANEDDSIFFRTSSVIRPTRTLNVTKNLTLGTQHEPDFTENGSQISTSEMTRFTCPESRQLITSQSPSFTLRDLVIEDCNSTSSIIELDTECDQQGSVGTARLFRIFIENNAVFGEAHIIDSRPRSCLHLELDDVLMRQNLCAIGSCMLLPPNNTLSNIQLFKNEGVNDSSSKSAIFSASKDSYTTAINVTSEGNQIRSFSVSNGTLIIVDSNFSGNTWNLSSLSQTRVNSIGGGVVFSNHSSVSISRTIFEHNYALNGGGIFALSSNVSINSCQFVGNDAGDGDGGALYGHYNSSFDISASLFFRNLGYVGAGLYSNYTTGVSIVNSKILENNCNRSCNFYINNGFASVKATEFIQNSAKQAGAALCANTTNIILENSTFVANSAKFGGACVFYFGSKVRGDELFFDNNEARVTNGGGICLLSESHMELRNSTFQRNKARGHGGAVYATRSSKLSISQCYFSRNEAQFGGAIYGHDSINGTITNSNFIENQALFTGGAIGKDEFSNGVISNCSFTNNIADLYGGSIFLEKNTTLIVLNSNLANNEARFGESLFLQDLSTLNVSDCIFTNHIAHSYGGVILVQGRSLLTLVSSKLHNNRAENGGTLCFSDSSNGILLNNTFNNNSALVDGGAIDVHVDSSLSLFGSLFSSNYAVHGGVIYVFRSFLSIRSATFNFNNATFGATVYGKNATMNFTDTIFEANRAIESGGAILVTKSNLTLDNNTIQYNEAIEDCGGICAIHGSRIDARKLIVKSNLAEDRGGGIGLGNASSILCDQCIVTNNKAYSGAGLHIYSNNSIVIVARLLDSLFKGNFAQSHGGGISFDAPSNRRINCKNNDVICSYVILLNTSFVENYANHSGAAILSTFASGVLIDCDYKGRSRGFPNQNDFESLELLNPKQLCPSWIGNRVHPKGHGDIIGTYGHESLLTIEQDEEVRLVEYASNGYVLENVSSGKRLPIIYIKILDEFGVGPAPTLPNLFEARLSSQDGFIHREYPANFLAGSGNFSEVIGFASSGNYTLEIKFNNPALEMVNLTVIVRECNIGEEPTLDKLACQKCDAFSYNFNPDQVRGCTQCPYGGNCTRKYIAPKKGYWHKSPCHNSVQECLVEEACNYKNRYVALTNFTRNFSICNFTEIEVELYNDILCNEGYEGSLCGSCKKSYGLSATFLCLKCSRTILAMLMILGITMYLLATTAITIRGCLPISLKNEDDLSKSDTSSSLSEHLERDPEVNIEMVKMLVEGYIEREFSKESQIPNTSQIHATENQLKEEYELTRWRITEIFKIMINFLQTTALAANVNVQWTNGMLSLFEYSESPSFTLRDLVIEDCNSTSSLIELDTECDQQGSVGTVRLLRIFIENNAVSGEAHIIDSRPPSCLRLELEDVLMRQNLCLTDACMLLPPNNTLSNIQLFRNEGVNDSSSKSAIFSASKDSYTTAINVTSEGNQIRSFSVFNGSLIIIDSIFSNNRWEQDNVTRANSTGGGVLFSNHSSVSISSTTFEQNYALNGGGIFALSSNVSINDCQFVENTAGKGYGGALYGHYNSSFDISASVFIRNLAYQGAVLHSRNTTRVNFMNSRILENNSTRSCSVDIDQGIASVRSSEFFKNHAEGRGAGLCTRITNLTLENSTFIENNASSGGACYFLERSQVHGDGLLFDGNIAHGSNGGGVYIYVLGQLEFTNSTFVRNIAMSDGGALYVALRTEVLLKEVHFTNNTCEKNGGAIHTSINSELSLSQSSLSRNEAENGGSISINFGTNATISECNFTKNIASRSGGVIYSEYGKIISVSSVHMHDNEAQNGGSISFTEAGFANVSNSSFTGNRALNGGAIHLLKFNLTVQNIRLYSNSATFGGVVHSTNATMKFLDSILETNNASRSGGAIYMDNSTTTIENTSIQSNKAQENCGGICVLEVSQLEAQNLTLQSNSGGISGGGIVVGNGSSILCHSCEILNNRANSGAGMHVYSNDSILIVAQLQNSQFVNNSAQSYGGAIDFIAPIKTNVNCSNSNVICGHVILLGTSFKHNYANQSGAIILTTHTSGVLIQCEYARKWREIEGFLNRKNLTSLESLKYNQPCKGWTGNRLQSDEDERTIGTYGQKISLSIIDDEVRLVGDAETGYVLDNVSSGRQLPNINITILDEFGKGPAPTLPPVFEARLSSSDDLFSGLYPAKITDGSGNFSGVAVFAIPKNYTIQINSDNSNIETLKADVIVRKCQVGEEPTSDGLTCQACDIFSYNFNVSKSNGCEGCPTHATCRGRFIVPKEGYWHKSPCHDTIKECLVEEACSYDNRSDALMKFTNNYTDCNTNETELEPYNEALCNKGYKGLLCGSCQNSYGLSATFECLRCPSTIISLLIIIGIVAYLLCASAFTIRGCLPLNTTHQHDPSSSNRSSTSLRRSNRDPQMNVEMVKMLVEGHVPKEYLERRQSANVHRSQSQTSTIDKENEYELTRWRTTEIFKIMINFLQTIAVAANVNVQWTDGMRSLFKSAIYIGALTTTAVSRPIDCIVASNSAVSRAIWRMLVSLFVPGVVMGIFCIFWSVMAIKKGANWRYFLKRVVLSTISVTYISYLGLTRMAVRGFYCIDIYDSYHYLKDSTNRFWAIDTSIRCYGKEHSGIIIISIVVLIIVTICFPLFSSIVLFRRKESLGRRDIWIFETGGFLFRAFKEKFAFWESVVMFRKACLSVIIVFSYPLGGDSQGLLASVLLLFSLYVHLSLRPYKNEFKTLNHFESCSLLVSSLTFTLGLFFVNGRCSDSVRTFLAVLLLFGNIMFFLFLFFAFFYSSMVHFRIVLQCENIPLPDPPTWWNVLKLYIRSRLAKLCQ